MDNRPAKPLSKGPQETEVGMSTVEERLVAAEKVCLLFGWTGVKGNTVRDKATTQAWIEWARLYPKDYCDPPNHPDLNDEAIEALAAERDRIRAETLKGLAAL